MATAAGDLVIRIMAQTASAEAGFRRTRAGMAGVGASSQMLAFKMAGIAAGFMLAYTAVRKLSSAIREVEQFNQGAANSFAIMGDISKDMRKKILESAHDVAFATKHSATEVAKAYYYLTSAGLDAKQSLAAMPQVAKFAQAGNFDLSRATELATDAQHAMGMSSKDAQKNLEQLTRVTDVLVKSNTLADATTEQFAESITSKAGAAFRLVGKDIEELNSVLAALAQRGVKAQEAGTQLSRLMVGLKTNAIKSAEGFRQHGIAVFDEQGKMRHLADIIEDLEVAFAGMSDRKKHATILSLGFTKKSADLAAVLIGASGDIREYDEALRDAAGITGEVANKQLPELTKGVHQLSVAFGELKVAMLETPMEESGKWMQALAIATKRGGAGVKGSAASTVLPIEPEWMRSARQDPMQLFLGPATYVIAPLRDKLIALEEQYQKTTAAQAAMTSGAADAAAAAKAEANYLAEVAAKQAEAVDKAEGAIRRLGQTAQENRIEVFTQALKAAGVELWQITLLTDQFRSKMDKIGQKDKKTPADESREAAEKMLADWKLEEELFGTKGRGRQMQEWLRMPGTDIFGEDGDLLGQLSARNKSLADVEKKGEKDDLLSRANRDAKDLLSTLEQDVKLFGLDPRDRMIAELAEKFGPDQQGLLDGLREQDAKLDELEASTQGGAKGPQYAGAMERGSAEAYSAILNASKTTNNTAKQQLTETKRIRESLSNIDNKTGEEQTVSIPSA